MPFGRLDPGYRFFNASALKEAGCRVEPGMTNEGVAVNDQFWTRLLPWREKDM
jgi:hypothetical protein